jgi:hypothetical protein
LVDDLVEYLALSWVAQMAGTMVVTKVLYLEDERVDYLVVWMVNC